MSSGQRKNSRTRTKSGTARTKAKNKTRRSPPDRLVARAERQVERYRRVNDTSEFARRAELDLKRLHLYRAVLAEHQFSACAHA